MCCLVTFLKEYSEETLTPDQGKAGTICPIARHFSLTYICERIGVATSDVPWKRQGKEDPSSSRPTNVCLHNTWQWLENSWIVMPGGDTRTIIFFSCMCPLQVCFCLYGSNYSVQEREKESIFVMTQRFFFWYVIGLRLGNIQWWSETHRIKRIAGKRGEKYSHNCLPTLLYSTHTYVYNTN